jgi:hypothetical protein
MIEWVDGCDIGETEAQVEVMMLIFVRFMVNLSERIFPPNPRDSIDANLLPRLFNPL